MRRILAVIGLIVSSGGISAADEPIYQTPIAPGPIDATGLLVRLVGMTLACLALCFSVIWYVRRNRTAKGIAPTGRMVHKGTLALNRRAAVHLIEVDGQLVAVTTDASGLKTLSALSEPFEALLARATADDAAEAESILPRVA